MSVSWYVMRSKLNKEDFLARQLEAHGLEVYYPRIAIVPVNPRARKVRPYFPNYLFVHVDLEDVNLSDLQWMPGASGLISFGGQPASVPDHLIAALRQKLDTLNSSTRNPETHFQSGDVVIIQDGPFAGYEAIFDAQLSGPDRARVLLKFLQARQMPIDLQIRQIRHVKHS